MLVCRLSRVVSTIVPFCAFLVGAVALGEPHSSAKRSDGTTAPKPLSQYLHSTWQTSDGLPQNKVTDVIQTRDGYIWASTEEGVARYNGIGFQTFTTNNSPGLATNNIGSLDEDSDGNLWLIGQTLVRYTDGVFTSYPQFDNFVHCDGYSGSLALVTQTGVMRFANGRFAHFGPSTDIPAKEVECASYGREGDIWLALNHGRVLHIDKSEVQQYQIRECVDGKFHTRSIAPDENGGAWVSTQAGVDHILSSGRIMTRLVDQYRQKGPAVVLVTTDRQGNMWLLWKSALYRLSGDFTWTPVSGTPYPIDRIGLDHTGNLQLLYGGILDNSTACDGICLYENGIFEPYDIKKGLSGPASSAIRDTQGNVWIATNSGLDYLRNSPLHNYTKSDGISSNNITCVAQGPNQGLWIGTVDGALSYFRGDKFSTVLAPIAGKVVDNIVPDDTNTGNAKASSKKGQLPYSGSYWLLRGYSLYHFDGTPQLQPVQWRSKSGPTFAATLCRGIHHDLWLSNDEGIAHYIGCKWFWYGSKQGFPNNMRWFFSSYVDHLGRLWLGGQDALLCFDNGRFTTYGPRQGIPNTIVTAIYEDQSGVLWFGHWGHGLTRYKNDRFTNITVSNGLYADGIYQILDDDAGNLWFGSSKGIFKISRTLLNAYIDHQLRGLKYTAYDTQDGGSAGESHAGIQYSATRASDGKLWFGTTAGLVCAVPTAPSGTAIPTVIEKAIVNGVACRPDRNAVLKPGNGTADFSFTGLDFQNARKLSYRYRLLGLDPTWVDAQSRHTATYVNLPPGAYRFQVRAIDDNAKTLAADFAFTIRPHYYQTDAFRIFVALLFAGLTYLLIWLRMRVISAHARTLEVKVAERTEQLTAANTQLRMLQEELEAQNEELQSQQGELEAQNQELQETYANLDTANRRLEELATTDGLTGLKNNRAFRDRLAEETDRYLRHGRPLSLILLDVDKFKQYNDTYGHPEGDDVLRKVAARLREFARADDFVARYGGEEFVIIAPETDAEGIERLAERLRAAVESGDWPLRLVTASFGAATMSASIDDAQKLITAADQALYVSKRNGRNRVTHIQHAMIEENAA